MQKFQTIKLGSQAFKQKPISKSQMNKKPIQTHVKGENTHKKINLKKIIKTRRKYISNHADPRQTPLEELQ